MPTTVEITRCWHDTSDTIGYADGKVNGREFTASWMKGELLGGILFDSWCDTTTTQNKAIGKALNQMNAIPEIEEERNGEAPTSKCSRRRGRRG